MGTYLTKGTTFTTGDSVTAASLNNLVDNATVTAGSIGSTELATNAVTADKISTASPQPVTTGTIRNNAVDNTKLEDMGSQTVKVRATNSTGDPSNLPVIGGGTNGSSKMLVGTSDSINAVTASQFKLVNSSDADVTNNTAAKLRLHTTSVSDWDTVAAATDVHDDNDRLLFYDADGVSATVASLKQIAPKKLIQSLPATTAGTGAVRIASGSAVTDPFNATTVEDAFAPTQSINCPIFAKAWASISSSFASTVSSGSFTLDNSYNIGTEQSSGTLTSSTAYKIIEYKSGDNFTNVGASSNATGVQFTASGTTPTTWTNGSRLVAVPTVASQGIIQFHFSDPMPSTNYTVLVSNAFCTKSGDEGCWSYIDPAALIKTTSKFQVTLREVSDGSALTTPKACSVLVFGT
tara:strand:+ start:6499 stop:7719 length:1221 start_codon:yes stop_codon:yes gene_type:complete